MLAQKRQNEILNILKQRGEIVKMTELAQRFHVSHETIRRDLEFLHDQKRIQRVYGGAKLLENGGEGQLDSTSAKTLGQRKREAIGRAIAAMIREDERLLLSTGSTVLEVAKHLKRLKHLTIVTNSLVPCNGRFPTLIALITIFFVGGEGGLLTSLKAAVMLLGVLVLGVGMTLLVSRLLSATVLRGLPSSFALELPPYRRPRVGQIVVRSVLDRTLFVLGRAVMVAAPAGLVIWLCANVSVGDGTILSRITGFLDPLGRLMGLDGVILMAFVLGWPANEIVMPVMLMAYLAQGTLVDAGDLASMGQLLRQQGWTQLTAVCMMLFSLFHWPCSTTCLTIAKETGSIKWTALAVVVPTLVGMCMCVLVAAVGRALL